jgi:hypothetical protein
MKSQRTTALACHGRCEESLNQAALRSPVWMFIIADHFPYAWKDRCVRLPGLQLFMV